MFVAELLSDGEEAGAGEIVGFVAVHPRQMYWCIHGEMLHIKASYRDFGIGRRLLFDGKQAPPSTGYS